MPLKGSLDEHVPCDIPATMLKGISNQTKRPWTKLWHPEQWEPFSWVKVVYLRLSRQRDPTGSGATNGPLSLPRSRVNTAYILQSCQNMWGNKNNNKEAHRDQETSRHPHRVIRITEVLLWNYPEIHYHSKGVKPLLTDHLKTSRET